MFVTIRLIQKHDTQLPVIHLTIS